MVVLNVCFIRRVVGRCVGRLASVEAERAQGLVEYSLIMSLVVLAVIFGLSAFGVTLATLTGKIVAQLPH